MIVCVPVLPDGDVDQGWCHADRIAVVSVDEAATGEAAIQAWDEIEVGWDALHDEGGEGAHHARQVTFLRDHAADLVIAGRIGQGMARVFDSMGLRTVTGVSGSARSAVVAAVTGQG